MEREIITIETPIDKHKVAIKAYVTGREKRKLTNVFVAGAKDVKFSAENKDVNMSGVDVSLLDKAEDEAFKLVIVSINGHKDGDNVEGKPFSVIDYILDMKLKDYEMVAGKVKEITDDKQFETQKKI